MNVFVSGVAEICNANGIKTIGDLFTERAYEFPELDILRQVSRDLKPEAKLSFFA